MKMTIVGSTLALGLLAALSLTGCAESASAGDTAAPCQSEERRDILDTAARAGSFATLLRAIEAAGLTETLRGEGPFTVFAPTDEAFSRLPEGTLEKLLSPENKDKLRSLLLAHVASGTIDASEIKLMSAVPVLEGQSIEVEAREGRVSIGGAEVVCADIMASNGVIHVVNAVILPPEAAVNPEEPVVNPEEPVVTPQEPVVTPQEPVVTPQEPVITPQEPVTTPAEPVVNPQEPVVNPEEPVTTPEEPVVNPEEPVTTPEEPVVNPEEPGTTPEEPVVNPEEPRTPPKETPGCPSQQH